MAVPRRRIRVFLITILAATLLVLLVPLALLTVGVTVDAGPWRDPLAQTLGKALKRDLVFDGAMRLHLSLRPELRVAGARVLNPPGFEARDLATFGEIDIRLDLWPLLHRQLRVLEVRASDVRVQLELQADGRRNWRVDPGRTAAATAPMLRREDFDGVGIDRVRFERVAIEFRHAGAAPHAFSLDTLDAQATAGMPLHMSLQGRVEHSFPYTVTIDAGPLSQLLATPQPWPLKLGLRFANTELDLDGHTVWQPGADRADLSLSLRTDELSQLEQLLQVSLPPVGATRLGARVVWQPGLLKLNEIDAQMGQTALRGQLELATTGPVPHLSGALTLPTLDLQPFRGQAPVARKTPRNLLDIYRELQAQTFDLKRLAMLDADLSLKVGQWLSLPGEVHDATLDVRLHGGVLQAPVQVQVGEVALKGRLDVDAHAATPNFALALSAHDSPLGELAALLADLDGIQGRVGHFGIRLAAQGATLGALTQSLDVALALDQGQLSYGNKQGARPVEFRLDHFEAALPAGAALRGQARGALLGETFSLRLRGGTLPALASGARWPVALTAQASGAQLDIAGDVLADRAHSSAELRVALDAPRSGSVARWLGLAPDAQVPFHFDGLVQARPDAIWLRDFSLALGRTRLGGELGRTGLRERKPLAHARLAIAEVDLPQLQSLLPPPKPRPEDNAPTDSAAMLALPILPAGLDLSDTDFTLSLQRLRLSAAEITEVRFEGQVREGRMPPAPFAAVVAGTPFTGSVAVNLRGALPEVALQLSAEQVDVGQLLSRLKVVEGVDARIDVLQLALMLRGRRLADMLERSDLAAELRGGQLNLRNPLNQPLVSIAIGHGSVTAPAGEPLRLAIDGAIDDTPIAIRLASGRLPELAQVGGRVPFKLSVEAAEARLEIDGSARVPLRQPDGDLTLHVAGRRLDTLNGLAHTTLPPWGPWSLGGKFVAAERSYEVPDLQLQIGSSRLAGRGALSFSGARPRAEVTLRAPMIQLDDFPFGHWSPMAATPSQPKEKLDAAQLRERARKAAQQGQHLLSRSTLLKQDADLDIQVEQVRSGTDRLGNGQLHLRLNEARLELAPAEVRIPSGAARLALSYEPLPGDTDAKVRVQLNVDRFDYAVLARRYQPASELRGEASVHLDLHSTSPLDSLMQNVNGQLDVAVWPVSLKAGVFDLWAVNVFVAALPALDGSATSKVNCAVASFDLIDGRLKQHALLVDTSRLRAHGKVRVDFHDESLDVLLQPKSKEPQFFSLATPVEVTGHITDYKVGLPAGSILATVGRFFGSVVTTPFEMLTSTPPPADGADVCAGVIVGKR